MATTYKVLGQNKPAAATNTDIITVGAGKNQVISTVIVTNTDTGNYDSIDLRVRVAGAANNDKQYILKGVNLSPLETITLTLGITLDATDVVTVYSNSGYSTFNIFGSEIA